MLIFYIEKMPAAFLISYKGVSYELILRVIISRWTETISQLGAKFHLPDNPLIFTTYSSWHFC